MQHVTRDAYERKYQQRAADQIVYSNYQAKIHAEMMDKVHQEADARAVMRHKAGRQRIADREFETVERIYKQQRAEESRQRERQEQDAIAIALHDQIQGETRDQKTRGVLRDNDHDYRELKSKLLLARITETRDNQRRENVIRRQQEEQERIEAEQIVLRNYRHQEAQRAAEEEAKRMEAMFTGSVIQDQMRDKIRRSRLIDAASAERDRDQIDAIVRRVADEDRALIEATAREKARQRDEQDAFYEARERLRAEERRVEAEELEKMRAFTAAVDERLARAKAEQARRERNRAGIAHRIAWEIKRKDDEARDYENMCIELARQQELEKLRLREEAEARKIADAIADLQRFMAETHRAKAARIARDKEDEVAFQREVIEEQRRLAELAEIEHEKNRIRIEKFRRELARQVVDRKEMYEAARQEELRKLQLEQEREEERQRILNEERRKLVLGHILNLGPEAIRYLPKGVLKEEDLDYLPEDYRNAVLAQPPNQPRVEIVRPLFHKTQLF
jgi:trichohyalin